MVGSLWMLCVWIFLDDGTFGIATTPLLLFASRRFPIVQVALWASLAGALGCTLQLFVLRSALAARRPWMRRFLPRREALEATLKRYPSTSFAAIFVARATPMPDAPFRLVAAVVGYPPLRYFLAVLLGAIPYYGALAWIGHRFTFPVWLVVALLAVIGLSLAVDRLLRGRNRGEQR